MLNDQDNQKNADHERDFHIAYAGANGIGAVDRHVHLDGGRDRGLQTRHLLEHGIDTVDNIGARDFKDDDENGVFQDTAVALCIVAGETRGVDVGN